MKKFYFLILAVSEFHVHKRRFFLTSFAIAWGTCAILLMLAFGGGIKQDLSKTIAGIGDNILLFYGRATTIPYKGLPANRDILLDKEDVELICEALPQLKSAGGLYERWDASAIAGKITGEIRLFGVDETFGKCRYQIPEKGGRFLSALDITEKRRVIFIGSEVAKKFFKTTKVVGKILLVDKVPFTIIGVLQDKKITADFGSDDNSKTYIPESTFAALYGEHYYHCIILSLKNPKQAEAIKTKIFKILGSKHKFSPEDKMTLFFWDTITMIKKMSNVLLAFQALLGTIGLLTLLISGVGLANIMYASIKTRTREIGIKIAIGAQPKQILKQIITESFFFSIAGGGIGGIAAIIIAELIKKVKFTNEGLKFFANPQLSVKIAIITGIILTLITFLAGYFPAKKAAKQNPVDSLRYE